MTFLYPYNLFWALLAIPLLLLYVAPALSRQQKVSSLPMWKTALAMRSPWRQWRRVVSLAMHTVTLLLIVVALAHPQLTIFGGGRRLVVIVDASASMTAETGGVTALAEARRDARRVITRLGRYDQAAVLSTSGSVVIRSRMTGDAAALHAAIDSIQHTTAPGSLTAALRTAEAMVAKNTTARIVVLTDHAGASSLSAVGKHTTLLVAGKPAANLAITQLAARPVLTGDNAYDVTVEVANFSQKESDVTLSAGLLAAAPQQTRLKLPPGGKTMHSMLVTPAADGWFQAELNTAASGTAPSSAAATHDALLADNRVWLPLPQRIRKKVALVTSGSRELEPAIKAFKQYETSVHTISDPPPVAADVTVYDGATPAKLPSGAVIVFFPANACDLWQTPEVITQYTARWQEPSDKEISNGESGRLSRGVEINRISFEDVASIVFNQDAVTLAASKGGVPLISRIDRSSGPVFVVHIDLEQSDWPLRPQFPRFVGNLLQAATGPCPPAPVALTTANRVHIAAASTPRQLTSPAGVTSTLPAGASPRFTETGFWQLDGKMFAVNLLSSSESNLQPEAQPEAKVSGASIDSIPQTTDGLPLWLWLTLAATAVAGAEWLLFHRRITI